MNQTKCPNCDGNGYLLTSDVPEQYRRIECPDCDGFGFIQPPTGNYCLACGEPIPLDKKWCDFHKEAENIIL